MDIQLSQDELKVIVGILTQVQLVFKDSIIVNKVILKLDSHIEKTPLPDSPAQAQPVDAEVVKENK